MKLCQCIIEDQGTHSHYDFIYLCCVDEGREALVSECKTQWVPLCDVLAISSVPEDVKRIVMRLLGDQSGAMR